MKVKSVASSSSMLSIHKKINTTTNLFWFLGISFIILLIKSQVCNCRDNSIITKKTKYKLCQEFQYKGLSMSHLLLWIVIGFIFPDKFWLSQLIGVLFEVLEYGIVYYDNNANIQNKILYYLGGCMYYPRNKANTHHILDAPLGPHSNKHWWHVKFTDIILNVIGFLLGLMLYKIILM